MVVLVYCQNEEDPIKNQGARVVTILSIDFSDAHGPKFKLIQAFIVCFVICKNEEDPSINNCTRVATIFLPL